MIGIVSLVDDVKTWAEPLIADIEREEPDMEYQLSTARPGEGSYAASINELGRWWYETTDDKWFIPMNADISLHGPFQAYLDRMPTNKLYGMTINTREGLNWIDGWIYVISREVWEAVGEFDENFKIACFEDADYSWRAIEVGYPLAKVNFPFHHHRASPRMRVKNFWKIRKENQAYLVEKYGLGKEWSYR